MHGQAALRRLQAVRKEAALEHRMISIADQVFEQLEHDILSGVYERDEILT